MMALSGVRISWLILARKSDFADDARSASRLAAISSSSAFFHGVMSRNTAQNLVALVAEPAHGHEQRDQAAEALAADHLAAVVEQRRDAGALQPLEIVDRGADALRREQIGEALALELVRVIAEQRLRAAVRARRCARRDRAPPRRRSRYRGSRRARSPARAPLERRFGRGVFAWRHGQERERRLAVPRHLQQPRFGDGALVAQARDRERLCGRPPRSRCRRTRSSGCRARPLPPARRGCRCRPSPGTPCWRRADG